MKRRQFIKGLAAGSAAMASQSIAGGARVKKSLSDQNANHILLQHSPIAGFQFYEGERLWRHFEMGQKLLLVREPHNRYDKQAVEIYWQDPIDLSSFPDQFKLGYVPRQDNCAVHQLMDRGEKIIAYISQVRFADDPWRRLEMMLFLESG